MDRKEAALIKMANDMKKIEKHLENLVEVMRNQNKLIVQLLNEVEEKKEKN